MQINKMENAGVGEEIWGNGRTCKLGYQGALTRLGWVFDLLITASFNFYKNISELENR
jgi:hypothetical protein